MKQKAGHLWAILAARPIFTGKASMPKMSRAVTAPAITRGLPPRLQTAAPLQTRSTKVWPCCRCWKDRSPRHVRSANCARCAPRQNAMAMRNFVHDSMRYVTLKRFDCWIGNRQT